MLLIEPKLDIFLDVNASTHNFEHHRFVWKIYHLGAGLRLYSRLRVDKPVGVFKNFFI